MIDMEQDAEKARAERQKERAQADAVKITGVDVPFGDLVALMVKLALAAVPAGLIIALAYWAFAAFFYAVLQG